MLLHEAYLHSGDAQNSAFNIYKLSTLWLPWFVLAEPAWVSTLKELGVDVDKPWGAIGVLPMGWLSATGIMQHLASRLTAQARLAAGVRDDLPEHSRGTHGAVGDDLVVRDYADAFMDATGRPARLCCAVRGQGLQALRRDLAPARP